MNAFSWNTYENHDRFPRVNFPPNWEHLGNSFIGELGSTATHTQVVSGLNGASELLVAVTGTHSQASGGSVSWCCSHIVSGTIALPAPQHMKDNPSWGGTVMWETHLQKAVATGVFGFPAISVTGFGEAVELKFANWHGTASVGSVRFHVWAR